MKKSLKGIAMKTNNAALSMRQAVSEVYKRINENGVIIAFNSREDYMIYLSEREFTHASQE